MCIFIFFTNIFDVFVGGEHDILLLYHLAPPLFFLIFIFCLFSTAPMAYGGSQGRG